MRRTQERINEAENCGLLQGEKQRKVFVAFFKILWRACTSFNSTRQRLRRQFVQWENEEEKDEEEVNLN